MKAILLAMLMLICISCNKDETPEPAFNQLYWMEYTRSSGDRILAKGDILVNVFLQSTYLCIEFIQPHPINRRERWSIEKGYYYISAGYYFFNQYDSIDGHSQGKFELTPTQGLSVVTNTTQTGIITTLKAIK